MFSHCIEYVKEAGEVIDPYGGTKEMYVHTYEELVSLILKLKRLFASREFCIISIC